MESTEHQSGPDFDLTCNGVKSELSPPNSVQLHYASSAQKKTLHF